MPQNSPFNPNPVDLEARGTRNPLHTALIRADKSKLYPIMAHPLRPNETLRSMRVQGWQSFAQMVKLHAMTPILCDLLFVKVPVSQLGDDMMELVLRDTNDGSDVIDPGETDSSSTAARTFPLSSRNLTSFGLPNQIGLTSGATWVPRATEKIAELFYDVDRNKAPSTGWMDNDVPIIDHPVRSTSGRLLTSGLTATGDIGGLPTSGVNSGEVGRLAEQLSIIGKADQTYLELLESYGVDPSRVRSLPEIISWQRRLLRPTGSPQMFGATSGVSTSLSGILGAFRRLLGGEDFVGDEGGMAGAKVDHDFTVQKNIMVDEPSFLMGFVAWWNFDHTDSAGAHYLDVAHMIHPGHWGPPSGGLNELDFLFSRDVADDTSGFNGLPATGNLLNLYLNGDSFCNDLDAFELFGLGDSEVIPDSNQSVNTMLSIELDIATDIVA